MIDTTVTDFRQTFMSDSGKRVLALLLIDAGYFDTDLKTTEELAVLNFVKGIIKNLGVCLEPNQTTEFVNKLFELRVKD